MLRGERGIVVPFSSTSASGVIAPGVSLLTAWKLRDLSGSEDEDASSGEGAGGRALLTGCFLALFESEDRRGSAAGVAGPPLARSAR